MKSKRKEMVDVIKTKRTTIKKLKIGDAVMIIWVDITSHSGWHLVENPKHFPMLEIKSMGFVIDKTKDQISISHTYDNMGRCDTPFSFPLGCIKRTYLLDGLGFDYGSTKTMDNPNCIPGSQY